MHLEFHKGLGTSGNLRLNRFRALGNPCNLLCSTLGGPVSTKEAAFDSPSQRGRAAEDGLPNVGHGKLLRFLWGPTAQGPTP
jgi:hypothetical protein